MKIAVDNKLIASIINACEFVGDNSPLEYVVDTINQEGTSLDVIAWLGVLAGIAGTKSITYEEVDAYLTNPQITLFNLDETPISAKQRARMVESLPKLSKIELDSDYEFYVEKLNESAKVKVLGGKLTHAAKLTEAGLVDKAEQHLNDVLSVIRGNRASNSNVITAQQGIDNWMRGVRQPGDTKKRNPTVATGIESLDKILGGGLWKQQVTLLTGYLGTGKSTHNEAWAINAMRNGKKVLLISSENTEHQIIAQLICTISGFTRESIYRQELLDSEMGFLRDALQGYDFDNFKIYAEGSMPVETAWEKAREYQGQYDILYVDLINNFRVNRNFGGSNASKDKAFYIMEGFEGIARNYDVPVCITAQQNRDSQKDGGGGASASTVADSNGYAEKASEIIGIIPDEKEAGEGGLAYVKLRVEKGRNMGNKGRSAIVSLNTHNLRVESTNYQKFPAPLKLRQEPPKLKHSTPSLDKYNE